MHEVLVSRLGRRKGIGLVQESANGNTGHGYCLSELFMPVTLDSSSREAQATKQSRRAWLRTVSGLLFPSLRGAFATKQSSFACRMCGTGWLHCTLPVIASAAKQSILSEQCS